ncbi:MAG TPA: DNA polymerase III subunit chi [Acidiferrobacterales bacterium]|jgi:DNA polymerase-3 subunit chi
MTRVDFYLQRDAGSGSKELLACRLVDKAYRLGHRAYVLAADADQARRVDELLWTHSAGSFVPHGLYDPARGEPELTAFPVLIGAAEPPSVCHDLLVCLAEPVPASFSRFARLAEVVGPDEADKARARERYRFYRDRGYPLESHTL